MRILEEDLSVRAVEQAVRPKTYRYANAPRGGRQAKSPETKALEEDHARSLSRKVELQTAGPFKKRLG